VLLGVVASDARLAARALRDWCGALGLEYAPPQSRVEGVESAADVAGSVYVKYNSKGPVSGARAWVGLWGAKGGGGFGAVVGGSGRACLLQE
jgi:hypothetical protein